MIQEFYQIRKNLQTHFKLKAHIRNRVTLTRPSRYMLIISGWNAKIQWSLPIPMSIQQKN